MLAAISLDIEILFKYSIIILECLIARFPQFYQGISVAS
jgi:hypothetical protein